MTISFSRAACTTVKKQQTDSLLVSISKFYCISLYSYRVQTISNWWVYFLWRCFSASLTWLAQCYIFRSSPFSARVHYLHHFSLLKTRKIAAALPKSIAKAAAFLTQSFNRSINSIYPKSCCVKAVFKVILLTQSLLIRLFIPRLLSSKVYFWFPPSSFSLARLFIQLRFCVFVQLYNNLVLDVCCVCTGTLH